MATFDLGDVVRLDFTVKVDGVLTAPTTIALTIRDPAGVVTTYTPVLVAVGTYRYDFVPTLAGGHVARWVTTGTGQAAEEQPFSVVAVFGRLVTVAEAKSYMGVATSAHDGEIGRLCTAALGVIENMAGPVLVRRQFVEVQNGAATLLLDRYPIVSLESIGSVLNGVTTISTTPATIIDGALGRIASPLGYGTVQVTYTAGLAAVPDEAVDAALTYVSYRYRRNHGGSESYMPAGVDGGIAPPMGVDALNRQIRLALGPYARGALVA